MREIDAEVLLVTRPGGDRAAYDELVRNHFERVYTLMFRMTRNTRTPRTWRRSVRARLGCARELPRGASFSTWVQRIGVHLAIAHQNRRAPRARPRDRRGGRRGETRRTGGNGVGGAVSRALDELPPRLRAAIVLRSLESAVRRHGAHPRRAAGDGAHARHAGARLIMRWLAPWFDGGRDEQLPQRARRTVRLVRARARNRGDARDRGSPAHVRSCAGRRAVRERCTSPSRGSPR
jgi:DNA-directed RNA polymerase specialized sigma24 family protein